MLISEIKGMPPTDPGDNPNEYLILSYKKATARVQTFGEKAFTRINSISGIQTNEVYSNGYVTSIFIMDRAEPIFLLNLTRLYKGYSATNVVTHTEHRGKGFAVPTYLAVSKAYGVPLYSFGIHTPAGEQIWQTLHRQYPDRVRGINVKTGEDIDFVDLQDSDFNTRAVLYPDK